MQTFDFLQPAQWPKWKQRFEQFRVASGLIDQSEGRQISTLLYSMGPEAQDELETTGIDEGNRGVYDSVITINISFDEYFGETSSSNGRNSIHESSSQESRQSSRVSHLYSATIYYRPLARTLANALHRSNLTDV